MSRGGRRIRVQRAARALVGLPLNRRARSIVAVILVAAACGVLAGYKPTSSGLKPRGLEFGVAKAQLFIDTPTSSMLDADQDSLGPPQFGLTYALFLQTGATKAAIEQAAGLPPRTLQASGPFTELLSRPNITRKLGVSTPPVPKGRAYRLVLDVAMPRPILSLYGQAPTAAEAARIVAAAEASLRKHVAAQQRAHPVPEQSRSVLRSLGAPTSGMVDAGIATGLMAFVFAVALALGLGVLYLLAWRRRVRLLPPAPVPAIPDPPRPALDNWPHTTRPLPWALAAFAVMIFLLPFDAISLPIPIPMDGKLDRPVLLVLLALWVLAMLGAHKSERPRFRLTRVHVAALVFFSIACLGAVFNAPALLNLDELALVLKKLALLASFIAFLFVVASSVRPGEVPAFVKLMLGLSLIVAVGAILEYRLNFNPFYAWTAKVLPVAVPGDMYGRDSIGRLTVYGSAGHPLELATMLAMMIPFALLGVAESVQRRERLLYSIAVALLFAGAMSTVRKTSIVAPIPAIIVVFAYRPRMLTKRLLPLGAVLAVAVHFAAPGAIGSLVYQLSPAQFGNVRSTQDRAADYDGVRPDVTRHLLFGRGYQSYDGHKYRILDNEYLSLVLGVGLLGLLAYLALLAASLSAAHGTIRRGDAMRSRFALGGTAAVVVVATATLLFDNLSFPHVPYLLFFIVGMLLALREPAPASDQGFAMRLPVRERAAPVARARPRVPATLAAAPPER